MKGPHVKPQYKFYVFKDFVMAVKLDEPLDISVCRSLDQLVTAANPSRALKDLKIFVMNKKTGTYVPVPL